MLTRVGIKVNLLAQTKSKYFGKILLQAGNQTSMYMLGWTPSSTDAHNALLNWPAAATPRPPRASSTWAAIATRRSTS